MAHAFDFLKIGDNYMLSFINLIAAVSMQENLLAVQTVQANDDQGGNISYSITGGADAAKFSIDAATGALAFISSPDFDLPGDANADNVYHVEVTASSDSGSADVSETLTVTITSANDALEKSMDFAQEAGDKIAEEKVRNDEQDQRLNSAEEAIAEKASQADLDTTNQAVAEKASQADLDTTNQAVAEKASQADLDTTNQTVSGHGTRLSDAETAINTKASQADLTSTNNTVTNNGNRVTTLEGFFSGNIIKLENIPEQLRTGMKPLGTFAVGTDALPAATVANEFQYYIADSFGQVDFSEAQDDSDMRDVAPKDWIISTGDTGWQVIAGGDGLTNVNGKTAQNGAVEIVSQDVPYAPSEASGLTANTAKGGIDEVGVKLEEVKNAIGNVSEYDPKSVFLNAYNARVAQG